MQIRNLSVLNYAQGFTYWVYRCEDLAAALMPGYFDFDMFADGDVIIISAKNAVAQRAIRVKAETVLLEQML